MVFVDAHGECVCLAHRFMSMCPSLAM